MSNNRVILALVVILGFSASYSGYRLGESLEYELLLDSFHQHAINKVSSLENDLSADFELLHNLRSFYESSEFVSRDEFANYTSYALQRRKEVRTLEWVPKVEEEQRSTWELAARDKGYADFQITEKSDDGELVPASSRREYYPVFYVEPLVRNEAVMGFDINSNPERKEALENARDNNSIVATAPVRLVQDEAEGYGVVFFLPVFEGNPVNIEQRRRKLQGFVVLAASINDIFDIALQYLPENIRHNLVLYVDDVTNGKKIRLYETNDADVLDGAEFTQRLSVAGREWQITFNPTHALANQIKTMQPLVIFITGLLLTGFVLLYLIKQSRVKLEIEQLVQERTRELRKSEAKALAIMDGVVNAIVVIDSNGIMLKYNRAAEKMFGYSEDEVLGRNVNMLMPEPYHTEHDQYLKNFKETGVKKIIGTGREVFARCKNGNELPIYLGVTDVKTENERVFVGVMIDLSERYKLDRIKSEFVSTVSHELRTPLTAINGALRLVLGGALGHVPEKMQEVLEVAQRNTDRQLFMVNDLLDFQKLESGCMDFKYEPLDISELVQNAVVMNHSYAEQFGVRLAHAVMEKGVMVYVDPNRLGQVLTNFISNAIKFSPKGDVVTLQMAVKDDVVRVEVVDQGPGIPEDFRDRIFNRFAQADGSNTRKVSGTGLGLAISKMIIEEMKGSIGYESEEGKGSRFYFELKVLSGAR